MPQIVGHQTTKIDLGHDEKKNWGMGLPFPSATARATLDTLEVLRRRVSAVLQASSSLGLAHMNVGRVV